jgi:hypothetical protein
MLTKILFTLAVIALVIATVRFRNRTLKTPAPVVEKTRRKPWIRFLAMAVVSLMVVVSAVFLYLHWRDSNQIMQVSVIDSSSGRVSHYRVYRGKLEEKGFQTVDGRYVQLAKTERLEVAAQP